MSYKLKSKRIIIGGPVFVAGLILVQIVKKVSEESLWHTIFNILTFICLCLGGFLIWFFWVSLTIWAIKNRKKLR